MMDEQDTSRKELPKDVTEDSVSETSDPLKPSAENAEATPDEPQPAEQDTTLTGGDTDSELHSAEIAAEHAGTTEQEQQHLSEITGVPSGIGLAAVAGVGIAAFGVFALLTRRSKSRRTKMATVLPFVRTRRH